MWVWRRVTTAARVALAGLLAVRTVRLRSTRSEPDPGVAQRRNAPTSRIGVVPGLGI